MFVHFALFKMTFNLFSHFRCQQHQSVTELVELAEHVELAGRGGLFMTWACRGEVASSWLEAWSSASSATHLLKLLGALTVIKITGQIVINELETNYPWRSSVPNRVALWSFSWCGRDMGTSVQLGMKIQIEIQVYFDNHRDSEITTKITSNKITINKNATNCKVTTNKWNQ